MVAVFQSVAGDLLELAPVHFGDGASADWPPPEAAHINQGDDMQRDAMRAASRRKARKVASRAGGAGDAAASNTAAVAAGEAAAAAAPADGAAGGDAATAAAAEESESESSDDEEQLSGWAARPGNGWLRHNPVGVPTERELGTDANGGHCWRALLQRRAVELPAVAAADAAAAPPAAA